MLAWQPGRCDREVEAQVAEKRLERICLDRLLEATTRSPTHVEEREAPDFLVRFEGALVGVEVTRSLPAREPGKPLPQEQASLRNRVMSRARALYEAAGGFPLHVSAGFLDHAPLSAGRVGSLARELAECLRVEAAGLAVYQWTTIEPDGLSNGLGEVHSLRIIRVPAPDYGAWSANGFVWCRTVDESDLSGVLARKETKISAYRSVVSEVWLLIVVELIEAGEIVSVPIPTAPLSITTKFDRVFALNWLSGAVSEIAVIRGG